MEQKTPNEKSWKILKSEYISKRPWMTARKDCVELPDGRVNPEYWILEYPDWVNVIAITKDGQMLMERQYRHGLGRTCYELPCGVVEEGEPPLEAAKRELMEETGFGGGEWQEIMTLTANASAMNNLSHTFLAIGVEKQGEQSLDDTEDLEVFIMPQEKVRQLLLDNQIMQSLMVGPLYKYFFEMKQG